MTTVRCAIYTRKSSEEGLEQGFNSLHAQRDACEAYVLSQAGEGWTLIPTIYDDGGYSGGNMERPALKSLMADIDRGLIDNIVVYKVDRLTRSLSDFSKIVDRLDAKAVSFVSITQAFNTTSSMGRLTLNMLLSFAQFEREVTGERIRDKIAASKARGLWMGGRPPLGYDGVDRKLVVNDVEANVVRDIFQRYLTLGSVVKLARELEADGVRSKAWVGKDAVYRGGAILTRGAIYHLLSNAVYRGCIRHGEKLYPEAHPAIVDEALWISVQKCLRANDKDKPTTPRVGEGAYLKGLLFDDADNIMRPVHTRRHERRYHYYVSTPVILKDKRAAGSLPRVSAPMLDEIVVTQAGQRIRSSWQSAEEQSVRIRSALQRVVVGHDRIAIALDPTACHPELASEASEGAVTVKVRINLQRRNGTVLVTPTEQTRESPRRIDHHLVRSICLAREWRRRLEAGEVASVRELARQENLCHRHTGRVLPLAWLAPDLVTMIVEGRQPRGLTLRALTEQPLPRLWDEQRRIFSAH